ncbi:PREDICTED: trypsin-1-like [Cyphomyrmex costatus]|uniref:trypsin-1-like n=1 Tax=Cyphomyrmex costatus TaxID=456900 RepID=UPI00085220B3|nr:PREDICTED: trypsin-1-like [Cyphomyrmex costatus]
MALRILCLLSLLAFSQAGILPLFDPRIVNGKDAKAGEIPHQVSLQYKDSSFHFCGGSILNNNYVITAAHCAVAIESPSSVKVIVGTLNLIHPKSEHNVVKIIVHEEYDSLNSWINDIALLQVETPFVISTTVGHVPLPPKGYEIKTNDIAIVSGWGRLWQGGPTTVKLQRVNIFIADRAYCRYMYNQISYNIYATQVCAYDASIEKGSCHGDSGGPLTIEGKLIGLVSWANGCASTTYPTVYTSVVAYLDWIKSKAV